MMRRGYSILLVGWALLSGCSDRFSGDCDALSDRAIVLASDVADAAESRAVAVNGTALTGVQFLRKDGTGAPTDFSGVSAVVGNRATNGNITFTPTVPTYKLNNDRAYFRAYHPAGTVGGNLVTWGVDARTDILVSSVFDAGTYMAPITGPMVFRHVLAQLEVKCVADPLATTSEASVQLAWGRVTKVEFVDSYASVSFNTATGAVAGSGALGAVGLVGSDYHAALGATALTKAGFTAAGMLVPAATGTAPLKLRVTTEQGGVQDIAVQLQSGSTNMGFAAGLKHTVTLQFNAAEKQILVSATKVSEWALGHSAAPEVIQPVPPLMVYGQAPFAATGSLVGATVESYNDHTGTVADGKNGAYYTSSATAYEKERPYHRLEVALEVENGGAAISGGWAAARTWCANKTTDGGGWRLPRISELHWIYQNKAALEAVPGFAAFDSQIYFGVTEYSASLAWYVYFRDGVSHYDGNKATTATSDRVRCVRESPLLPFMVYGQAPFVVAGELAGSTTESYNGYTGQVAAGKNGSYYADYILAFANEKPYFHLEVALVDESQRATFLEAKKLCVDKTTDGGGWRLPRISELYWIYLNQAALETIPGFVAFAKDDTRWKYYYSATEASQYTTLGVDFYTGGVKGHSNPNLYARCVRERR